MDEELELYVVRKKYYFLDKKYTSSFTKKCLKIIRFGDFYLLLSIKILYVVSSEFGIFICQINQKKFMNSVVNHGFS